MATVLIGWAPVARAVDGRLDYRDNRQDGGSSGADYSLQMIRQEALLNQRIELARSLALLLDFRYLDEDSRSEIDGARSSWQALTRRAGLALHYHDDWLRLNLEGNGQRRDFRVANAAELLYDRRQLGGWANVQSHRGVKAQGSWLESWSRRGETLDLAPELQETAQSLSLETTPVRLGALHYRISRLRRDDGERDLVDLNTTHGLRYSGDVTFANRRGSLGVTARSRWFEQKTTYGGEAAHSILLIPFDAAWRVDVSPDFHDPLEDASLQAPELYDRDLDTATAIDLGDDAPAGWQEGGDYRNIHYDFGEAETLVGGTLYVAQRALVPELLTWRFFVSDDPEGRVWSELPGGAVTWTYHEWSDERRGWSFNMSEALSTRRFKIVNEKLGPVAPVLRVTELELYTPVAEVPSREVSGANDSQRLNTTLNYALSGNLGFRYDLGLRQRSYGSAGELNEDIHNLGLNWHRGQWRSSLRYELQHLSRGGERTTNVATATLSIGKRWEAGHALNVYASQVRDRSRDRNRVTNALSLGGTWHLAPDLRFDQRVSYGWLDDYRQDLSSSSVTVNSTLRGAPYNWLFADLARVDRWVKREAGIGFTRFNDTTFGLGWTPWPLLTFRSNIVYQVREDSELLTRHSVNWTPLTGGKISIRLHGTMVSDTRVDSDQRSVGVNASWELRPRLNLEGGLEAQSYERAGTRNSPLSSHLRGSLSF